MLGQFLLCFLSSVLFVNLALGVNPEHIPCVDDLETHFFREADLIQAFNSYQIPQSVWTPVILSLQGANQDVPELMKKATKDMVPNPIEYPMQKGPTAKILKQVLLQVFLDVMRQYQVNERPTADFVFDLIFARRADDWERCFGTDVELPKNVIE